MPATPNADGPVLVSDFDGTLTQHDLGELALQRFGLPGWERYDELFESGQITIAECIRKQSAMIRARSRTEILRYLSRFARFRPGLDRLLDDCRRARIDFVVASAGIDFCIRHVFRLHQLPMPTLYCPRTSFTPHGLRVVMPPFPPGRKRTGPATQGDRNFKHSIVASYQGRGRRVVYIGDGATDIAPASIADKVFAIRGSPLDAALAERGIPRSPIRTLLPVSRFVQAELPR